MKVLLVKNTSRVSFPKWKGIPKAGYDGVGGKITLDNLADLDMFGHVTVELEDQFMAKPWASEHGIWVTEPDNLTFKR